jgi:hypothetical protein
MGANQATEWRREGREGCKSERGKEQDREGERKVRLHMGEACGCKAQLGRLLGLLCELL